MSGEWGIKLNKKFYRSLSTELMVMNVISCIVGMLALPLAEWLIFQYLPGADGRVAYIQSLALPDSFYIGHIIVIDGLVFLGTFLWLFRHKSHYIKQIPYYAKALGQGDMTARLPVIGHDEISQLCETINQMAGKIQEQREKEHRMEQEKNELIQSVSHDLRTPLTAIKGCLQILQDEQYQSPQEMKQIMAIAADKTTQLESLIEELFECTRMADETYPLKKINFNLSQMTEQIGLDYMPLFQKKGLQFSLSMNDKQISFFGNPDSLARVLENLLNNALKYTAPEGRVELKLERYRNTIILTVANDCSDVDSTELIHLFDRFYRLEKSRSSKTGGHGLGLAIVKSIVQRHHGDIQAAYDKGRLAIRMTFPANRSVK